MPQASVPSTSGRPLTIAWQCLQFKQDFIATLSLGACHCHWKNPPLACCGLGRLCHWHLPRQHRQLTKEEAPGQRQLISPTSQCQHHPVIPRPHWQHLQHQARSVCPSRSAPRQLQWLMTWQAGHRHWQSGASTRAQCDRGLLYQFASARQSQALGDPLDWVTPAGRRASAVRSGGRKRV